MMPIKIQQQFIKKLPHERGWLQRLATYLETFRVYRREQKNRNIVALNPCRPATALSSADIPLVAVSHNEISIIHHFLTHYRKLGVTRFIIVDDASTDGTKEFLLTQRDVDTWESPVRFAEARRGRQWREQLFGTYGKNRWYLNLDSDEFLIFAESEAHSISDLIGQLDAAGERRIAAPMIDMYGKHQNPAQIRDGSPWDFADHFDRGGYNISIGKRGVSVKGGPRGRRFNEDNELIKYPLIYWDDQCFFGSSIHRPLPYGRNFPKTWGALLHFKFFVNYKEKISEAVEDKQHYGGSAHYIKLMDEINDKGGIDLYDENVSIKYTGSKQLEELGFITPIDWDKNG